MIDNNAIAAYQLIKLVGFLTKKFSAFKRKGGFRRLPPMPEVNIDECTDIEQYYAEQRARNFARRFYREHAYPISLP